MRSNNLCVEIMAIGSELLRSNFQDTNSEFLIEQLGTLGINIHFKTTVGDDRTLITTAFKNSISRSNLIFTIGGLGPTQDDITRESLATVLQKKLIFKNEILENIRNRFRRRNLSMPRVNRKQAYIIEGATILENSQGTAPGLWVNS